MAPVTRSKTATGRRATKRRRSDDDPPSEPPAKLTTTINDLPEELLERIAAYLNIIPEKDWGPPESREEPPRKQWRPRHLHPLSLVSKKFSRIATPLLYSTFVNDQQPTALYQFLHTIIHNPHLATHVRSVVIGAFDEEELAGQYLDDVSEADYYRFEAARPAMIKCAKKVDFGTRKDSRKTWLQQLEARKFEADVSFLLTQTPNLEVLDLETFAFGLHDLYACTFNLISLAVPHGNKNGIQGLFANLRHVVLTDESTIDHSKDHAFPEILHFPSLRNLEIRFIVDRTDSFSSLEKRSSNAEMLLVEEVMATPWLAPDFIDACRRLKHLVYMFGNGFYEDDFDEDDEEEVTYFDGLYSAVLAHKDTLETLVLQTKFSDGCLEPIAAIGPLKDLQHLRHLTISGVLLFDNLALDGPAPTPGSARELLERGISPCEHFFPQSLQSLEIEIYSVPARRAPLVLFLFAHIKEGRKHGLLPNLRRLKVITRPAVETGGYWEDVLVEAGDSIGLEHFRLLTVWREPDDDDE
ncbi:hypothetical protein SLS58_010675 [Diplodia intermedia]|uniref:Leucine-rich repeat domain-containing protein n=1 Tax=Diplodia intermedia TaxID=856260 RepID=A0ABR3T4B3_9PEZI